MDMEDIPMIPYISLNLPIFVHVSSVSCVVLLIWIKGLDYLINFLKESTLSFVDTFSSCLFVSTLLISALSLFFDVYFF